jgi:uncharacterized protein
VPLSMYQLSVPVFLRGLEITSEYCHKASAFCASSGFAPSILIDARLAPGMLPFAGQIQRVSDGSKGPTARLAGILPPRFEDTETTFPELLARIEKTSDFWKSITPAQLDGGETRAIEAGFPWGGAEHIDGGTYLLRRVLPNFYYKGINI